MPPSLSAPAPGLTIGELEANYSLYCKALRLRFASPRSKRGTNPREGLLKLYTATAEPADLLAGAITRFKAAHCGAGSILGDFRALLASAAAGEQPVGWEAAWSAAVAQRP